jgi:transcription elongation factor Elf1
MFVKNANCPACGAELIVDATLFDSGIELHCPECQHYFPGVETATLPVSEVCGASVPITIWRPDARGS